MRRASLPALAIAACLACNQAQLQEPPDAGVDACVAHTVTFCDAAPPDAAACVGDPGDAAPPGDASYPIGCTANVIGAIRDPNTGVCALAASCTCEASDASAAWWACSP